MKKTESIIFVPIERLEERYSDQWYLWFMKSFEKFGVNPIVVGDSKKRKITTGQFLDVIETSAYKAGQMTEIISLIEAGFEGSIFFMDLWFPGIEHIAYIRNNAKKNLKIEGILHAGTWDANDFLSKNGCGSWAKFTESGWFEMSDRIFVATKYHAELIKISTKCNVEKKMEVVEFPCYRNDALSGIFVREDVVVFPHRLADEKQPLVFADVEKRYREMFPEGSARFVRTKDVCKTKSDYYQLLAGSKACFSSALQETFGIAMLEGVALGCVPIAPNRLSYPETLKEFDRYETIDEACVLIEKAMSNYKKPTPRYFDNADKIVERYLS